MDSSSVVIRFFRTPRSTSEELGPLDEAGLVIEKRSQSYVVGYGERRRHVENTNLTLNSAQALRVYIDTLLASAMQDDDGDFKITHFCYEIPGFPVVLTDLKKMYGYSDEYETFCQAMELWLESE